MSASVRALVALLRRLGASIITLGTACVYLHRTIDKGAWRENELTPLLPPLAIVALARLAFKVCDQRPPMAPLESIVNDNWTDLNSYEARILWAIKFDFNVRLPIAALATLPASTRVMQAALVLLHDSFESCDLCIAFSPEEVAQTVLHVAAAAEP